MSTTPTVTKLPDPSARQPSKARQRGQQTAKKASKPVVQIFREAKGAHETSKQLLPLLDLLEDPEPEGGPLDEIKGLLEGILLALKHQTMAIETLEQEVAALREGRMKRAAASASSQPSAPSDGRTSDR